MLNTLLIKSRAHFWVYKILRTQIYVDGNEIRAAFEKGQTFISGAIRDFRFYTASFVVKYSINRLMRSLCYTHYKFVLSVSKW